MVDIDLPLPEMKTKPFDPAIEKQALEAGLHPVVARIVAGRPLFSNLPILQALSPRLKHLHSPFNMADMDKASSRVAMAIMQGECIGLETDHDCDGQTSHAVLYHNLVNVFMHPKEKVRSYIGHRLTEGYGLSQSVAERIINDSPKVDLIITADNGSSDEPRIKLLKEASIDVIVTDHHEIPLEGYPQSAYACLNPTRADCSYGDPYIAGCMVAWLLMAATRQKLIAEGYLPNTFPTLLDSLDFVAVGTIADCVSIARSVNNRAVVNYGLRLIEKGNKPCWRAIKSLLSENLTSEDLGFKIGPLLNSDGRLATAFGSVSFLLAETDEEAQVWLTSLQDYNAERKSIQQGIVLQGLIEAKKQIHQGRVSLCIFLKNGHSGVHGIAASRLKDLFGRPTAFFAPKSENSELITGSVRGIEGFHVREALQYVASREPEMLLAFGGHKGAGGLTLSIAQFDSFNQLFEEAVRIQVKDQKLGPIIWTEGELSHEYVNLDLVDTLNILEPFGREFEQPVFEMKALLKELRFIGDGTHARIILSVNDRILSGIWFKAKHTKESIMNVKIGDTVKVAFSLKANTFRRVRNLDMHIVHMEVD